MSILNLILNAAGGKVMEQVAQNFGLSKEQTTTAASSMIPALVKSFGKTMGSGQGMLQILEMMGNAKNEKFADDPESFEEEEMKNTGNNILGVLFGNNKDVSRNVAAHASKESGIDASILKKMLPVLATVALGTFSKKAKAENVMEGFAKNDSNSMSWISGMIDQDGDGQIWDDVLGMAKKFF